MRTYYVRTTNTCSLTLLLKAFLLLLPTSIANTIYDIVLTQWLGLSGAQAEEASIRATPAVQNVSGTPSSTDIVVH